MANWTEAARIPTAHGFENDSIHRRPWVLLNNVQECGRNVCIIVSAHGIGDMSSAALPLEVSSAASPGSGHAGRPGAFELLLAACSLHDPEERQREVRALLECRIRWTEVTVLAGSHGLIPILYRNLSGCTGVIPEESLRELRSCYERHARQALRLTQLLHTILGHLESQGIEALPYKGPVLAEALYENVGLRQFSDLDILVQPGDVGRAKAALERLGYANGLVLTNAQQKAYLDSGYEYAFDGAGQSLIELQWRILPRFYAVDFDTERMFAESSYLTVAGRQVRTPRTEDLFLVLCVHAAKHAWERLAWTRDVAELIESKAIDWADVRRRAEHLGILRILGITLVLARDLFGATIPPEMETMLRADRSIARLAATIRQNLLTSVEYDTESVAYFRLMLRLRERRFDRLRFMARLTFTPSVSEWSTIRLPSALFPLYRLVRMWRLLRRLIGSRSSFAPETDLARQDTRRDSRPRLSG